MSKHASIKQAYVAATRYCDHVRRMDYQWRYRTDLHDQREYLRGLLDHLLEHSDYQDLSDKDDAIGREFEGCIDAAGQCYLYPLKIKWLRMLEDYLLNLSLTLAGDCADEGWQENWNSHYDLLAVICEWSSLDYTQLKAECERECEATDGQWFLRFVWAEATMFIRNAEQIMEIDLLNETWCCFDDGYEPVTYPWSNTADIEWKNRTVKTDEPTRTQPIVYLWNAIEIVGQQPGQTLDELGLDDPEDE